MRREQSGNKSCLRRRSPAGLRLLLALTALLAWCAPAISRAASFTATLDRESVAVGETAVLTLKFEGGESKSMPALPPQANLQMSSEGSSRNISIVNGQYSASISQNFALTPTKPGEYTIPALRAEVGGKVLTTQPLKLTAVKGDSGRRKAGLLQALFAQERGLRR